ncbi:MAG: hypothetical protein C5B54_09905 [Acidobacteria bacterium]|nr:MAG: hypothetical protein C5B54_09905 [Acidobacteriota bacterium]
MNEEPLNVRRIQRWCIRIGILFSALAAIFLFVNRAQFFVSYLFAFSFWIGLTLGSLGILMVHKLTGGLWGAVIRRILEAAIRTLPVILLFFIPLLFGLKDLYQWSRPELVHASVMLQKKQPYLNPTFFVIRAVIYFAVWFVLFRFLDRWSLQQEETRAPEYGRKMEGVSGPGLILYGLTMTFASIDWFMSLRPDWYSTIYGLLICTGQMLTGFAFSILVLFLLQRYEPVNKIVESEQFHDLGNLLLTFVMLWAYLAFSQLLIIWSGDLPEEISWYTDRLHSWVWVGLFLVIFHFALPFVTLLLRVIKKTPAYLAIIASAILIVRWVDLYWMIAPDIHANISVHLADFLLPIALGAFWLYRFLSTLSDRPLIATHDPNFESEEAIVRGTSHAEA